jgi:hypothetical protein
MAATLYFQVLLQLVVAVVVTILRALVITVALVVEDGRQTLEAQEFQGKVLLALQEPLRLEVVEAVLALLVWLELP